MPFMAVWNSDPRPVSYTHLDVYKRQLDAIRALAAVGEGAIEGAITGRALYEGNFTLVQALAAARGEELSLIHI